jgi:hypothetical protein
VRDGLRQSAADSASVWWRAQPRGGARSRMAECAAAWRSAQPHGGVRSRMAECAAVWRSAPWCDAPRQRGAAKPPGRPGDPYLQAEVTGEHRRLDLGLFDRRLEHAGRTVEVELPEASPATRSTGRWSGWRRCCRAVGWGGLTESAPPSSRTEANSSPQASPHDARRLLAGIGVSSPRAASPGRARCLVPERLVLPAGNGVSSPGSVSLRRAACLLGELDALRTARTVSSPRGGAAHHEETPRAAVRRHALP